MTPRGLRPARTLTLLLLLGVPGIVRADLTGQIEPGYSGIWTVTESDGERSASQVNQHTQKYRLNLEQPILPLLRVHAGGILDQRWDWINAEEGRAKADARTLSTSLELSAGNTTLNGRIGYNWRERSQAASSMTERLSLLTQDLYFGGLWRPDGLPSVTLNLSRALTYDPKGERENRVSDTLHFNTRYNTLPGLDLRYALTLAHGADVRAELDTLSIAHAAGASYTERFFDQRTTVFVSYNLSGQAASVSGGGSGALISRQEFPVAGRSLIERLPAQPAQDTLEPNPALIDGDTAASAGIDLGWGVQGAGDSDLRDLGGEFSLPLPDVNTIFVWVDRTLETNVVAGFTWQVFESEDNLTWSPLPLAAPVIFEPLQKRFEISFQRTTSKFVKVVTRPLPTLVTGLPDYAAILVTEAQFFLVLPAAEAGRESSTLSNVLNASANTKLLASEDLYHDFSLFMTYSKGSQGPSYAVINSLNYRRALGAVTHMTARASREDASLGNGHEGAFLYGAGLGFNPLPTLSHQLVYGGDVRNGARGTSYDNSFTLSNNASIYRGIGMGAAGNLDLGRNYFGQRRRGLAVTLSANVEPHPVVGLGTSYSYGESVVSGGGLPEQNLGQQQASTSLSLRPIPAIYLTGAVTWSRRTGAESRLFGNYGINFSPFPAGGLQFNASFTETDEVDTGGVSRLFASSVRWNIRGGTYLTTGYTFSESKTTLASGLTHALFARLTVGI